MNKLTIEAVSPINLTLVNETLLSLLTNIASTPKRGIKSKDNNNIIKIKKKMDKYLFTQY